MAYARRGCSVFPVAQHETSTPKLSSKELVESPVEVTECGRIELRGTSGPVASHNRRQPRPLHRVSFNGRKSGADQSTLRLRPDGNRHAHHRGCSGEGASRLDGCQQLTPWRCRPSPGAAGSKHSSEKRPSREGLFSLARMGPSASRSPPPPLLPGPAAARTSPGGRRRLSAGGRRRSATGRVRGCRRPAVLFLPRAAPGRR